jgi:hypothetical protein
VQGGHQALMRGVLPNVKDEVLTKHESEMHEILHRACRSRATSSPSGSSRSTSKMTDLVESAVGAAGARHVRRRGDGRARAMSTSTSLLGERTLPTEQKAADLGAEVKNVRPGLTAGKIAQAEGKSARAGEKLAGFRDLDAHEQAAIKTELDRLVSRGKGKGGKPGARLLQLLAEEDERHAPDGEMLRQDMITAGKMVKDMGGFYVPSTFAPRRRAPSAPASRTQWRARVRARQSSGSRRSTRNTRRRSSGRGTSAPTSRS